MQEEFASWCRYEALFFDFFSLFSLFLLFLEDEEELDVEEEVSVEVLDEDLIKSMCGWKKTTSFFLCFVFLLTLSFEVSNETKTSQRTLYPVLRSTWRQR